MVTIVWAACGLYACAALLWLWLRGMGGPLGLMDRAIAVSGAAALVAFLVLLVLGDRPDSGPDLPWWRLFRRW